MRTILFLALGTLPLILAAAMTGNHMLYKTYRFLNQHRYGGLKHNENE